MRVLGAMIPEEAIARGTAAMGTEFTARHVAGAMHSKICAYVKKTYPRINPNSIDDIVMRAADRLIQLQKKAGKIKFSQMSRSWSAVYRATE